MLFAIDRTVHDKNLQSKYREVTKHGIFEILECLGQNRCFAESGSIYFLKVWKFFCEMDGLNHVINQENK